LRLRAAWFWASAGAAAWVLVGYPLALLARPARRWRRGETSPRVSIVIPAYRERDALASKLHALDDLDYPRESLEVIVAVDEDAELAQVARDARPDATVLFSAERRGKSAALGRALDAAAGEIVLLTDANNLLERDSIRAAVRHFADPAILAVAGRRGENGSAYDRYESLIRSLESRSGSVAAMSGEFIAVRREHVPKFPADVVNDDFWLLCQLVRRGGRVVYEPRAASREDALGAAAEVARRSRMSAGRVMALSELRDLPRGFALRALSHKYGRLALPFFLAGALVASLTLSRDRRYRVLAALQLAVYGGGALACAGVVPPGPAGRMARAAGQFTLGNAAVGAGVVRGLRGRQDVRWDPVR
jgi:glycosyltransferase involved in cell wall biosynthesis